jgi:hypothetical protein
MTIPELSELSLISTLLGGVLGFLLGALFTAVMFRISNDTMERWWNKKMSMLTPMAAVPARTVSAPPVTIPAQPREPEVLVEELEVMLHEAARQKKMQSVAPPVQPPVAKRRAVNRAKPETAPSAPPVTPVPAPAPAPVIEPDEPEAISVNSVVGGFKYKVVGAGPAFRSLEEALTVFPVEMRPVGATWETLPDKLKSMIERIPVDPLMQEAVK